MPLLQIAEISQIIFASIIGSNTLFDWQMQYFSVQNRLCQGSMGEGQTIAGPQI